MGQYNFFIGCFMNLRSHPHVSALANHLVVEYDFKEPKHVAESCKFIKYLIKSRVRQYFIINFN
jgi:hypothetical protein